MPHSFPPTRNNALCWLCSDILHAYVLACFFDIFCPNFFAFEKLASKNPYIEKFLFIQRSIQKPPEHLRSFLQKTIFAKRLKSIDFSNISSFLFPTVNKRTHKPLFWQHQLARIFINILYYLNSHIRILFIRFLNPCEINIPLFQWKRSVWGESMQNS